MKSLFGWWKSGDDKPLIEDASKVSRLYNAKRRSVISSVVLGYGIFDIGRLTISVAKKPMLDSGVINATELARLLREGE